MKEFADKISGLTGDPSDDFGGSAVARLGVNKRDHEPILFRYVVFINLLAFVLLPVFGSTAYRFRRETLGALWGPLVFSGQWWRILTFSWVHFDLVHLVSNMVVLWILGKRVERVLGTVTFALLYLSTGLIAGLTILGLHPEVVSFGASSGVAGLIGASIVIYGDRLRPFNWRAIARVTAVTVVGIGLVWREIALHNGYYPHTAGLLSGSILTAILLHVAKGKAARHLLFSVVLLASSVVFVSECYYYRNW